MKVKYIVEVDKLNNFEEKVTYEDGTYSVEKVIRIESREDAIAKAVEVTKSILKKPDAFTLLRKLKNDFSNLRNYEIEDYIDEFTGKRHHIFEECPFNGFSWYNA